MVLTLSGLRVLLTGLPRLPGLVLIAVLVLILLALLLLLLLLVQKLRHQIAVELRVRVAGVVGEPAVIGGERRFEIPGLRQRVAGVEARPAIGRRRRLVVARPVERAGAPVGRLEVRGRSGVIARREGARAPLVRRGPEPVEPGSCRPTGKAQRQEREREGEDEAPAEGQRQEQRRDQGEQIAAILPAVGLDVGRRPRPRRARLCDGQQSVDVGVGRGDFAVASAPGLRQPLQRGGVELRHRGSCAVHRNRLAARRLQRRALRRADAQHAHLVARLARGLGGGAGGGGVGADVVGHHQDAAPGRTRRGEQVLRRADGEVETVAEHRHQAGRELRQHLADHVPVRGERRGDEGPVGIDHEPDVVPRRAVENVAQLVTGAREARGHEVGAVHRLGKADDGHHRFGAAGGGGRQLFPGGSRKRQDGGEQPAREGREQRARRPGGCAGADGEVAQQMRVDRAGPVAGRARACRPPQERDDEGGGEQRKQPFGAQEVERAHVSISVLAVRRGRVSGARANPSASPAASARISASPSGQ